jgi:hypothetical protein
MSYPTHQTELLEECEAAAEILECNGGPDLTDWEREFLESVREQYDDRGRLTIRQEEILQQIHDKI